MATEIEDVKIFVPKVFADDRGYFLESFNQRTFDSVFGPIRFVQDNESLSQQNVVRGLHYQAGDAAQSKLVRVTRGAIWDVAVDLRRSSPTFMQWVGSELSETNRRQMFIPRGFAHGFVALTPLALVQYKVDAFYCSQNDRGIRFDDPALSIAWPLTGEAQLSQKDQAFRPIAEAELFQ